MNDSLFGTADPSDFPVLVPPDVLDDHVRVVGSAGGGKTAVFTTPMLTTLMRQSCPHVRVVDVNLEQTPPAAEGS